MNENLPMQQNMCATAGGGYERKDADSQFIGQILTHHKKSLEII
jgi:hypothetical protein